MPYDLLSSILSVVLGAALASAYRVVTEYRRVRRPAARIWTHAKGHPFHIVTAQDDSDRTVEFTPKVFPAEYAAALAVRMLLTQNLKVRDVKLWTSDRFPRPNVIENLVCIGGPVHNEITRDTLRELDLPIEFVGHDLVSKVSNKVYEAKIDHDKGRITEDIGVVVVARNPRERAAPNSCAVLLMGARTFGCEGAACYITGDDLARANDVLGDENPRWVILKVKVEDDFVTGLEVLESSDQATP
jgi:hypothetical protein